MTDDRNCILRQTLSDYLAGRLDDSTLARVESHLKTCEPCRTALSRLNRLAPSQGEAEVSSAATSEFPTMSFVAVEDADLGDEDPFDVSLLEASSDSEAIGRIGEYDVLNVVGQGGMGVVLKAFDGQLHRTIAIKLLARQLAASPKARRRFTREARASAGINHPNVVTIYSVDEHQGVPFLAMEYVQGQSLAARIRSDAPLKPTDIIRISSEIADGLSAAHEHGVIHRDIKPANIMLEGTIERVKIADFGLARALTDNTELTSLGQTVGTPAYMSPEQVSGAPLDSRSDLFSLGCVMYAMVTGRSPFYGGHPLDVALRIREETPTSLHKLPEKTPMALSRIVDGLLEKDPKKRFQSAAEVAKLLAAELAVYNQANTDQLRSLSTGDIVPTSRRVPLQWAAWLAVAALCGILVTSIWARWRTTDRVRDKSDTRATRENHKATASDRSLREDVVATTGDRSTEAIKSVPDVDRKAAEWVLSVGGSLKVAKEGGETRQVFQPAQLDASDRILWIDLSQNDAVSDTTLEILRVLDRLEYLQLQSTAVSNTGLKFLENLTRLQYLGLKATPIDNAGLQSLQGLVSLERLNLMSTSVSNEGFSHLKGLTNLNGLYLSQTGITDEGIRHFENMLALRYLELNDTLVTDEGLRLLKPHSALSDLYLRGTSVTDEGLDELHRFKQLRVIDVSGTQVTNSGVDRLQQALPNCDVRR